MSTHTLDNAKTHLSSLVEQVCAGEEAIIAKGKLPLVKLVAITKSRPQRRFGAMKGQAQVDDAFFDPLSDDELDVLAQFRVS